MSQLHVTAGSKLYIGAAKAFAGVDLVAADFASEVWTEIKGTTNLGGAGDTSELITSNRVAETRTRKAKGTRNAGAMAIVCDHSPTDAGQLALVAGERSSASFAFRLVFSDQPVGGTPSERLFTAFVMTAGETYDEANSAVKLGATLEIDSNIVRIAASA